MTKKKKEKKKGNKFEALVLAIVGIGVFSAIVLFALSNQPSEKKVNGVIVKSGWQEVKDALSSDRLVSEARMYSGQSELNSALSVLMVQVADEARKAGKELWTYGTVPGEENIGCTDETNNCSNPNIVLLIGECNCIYVDGGKVFVEADSETVKGQWTVKAAQVLGFAMSS
jgi:hypothetical protein